MRAVTVRFVTDPDNKNFQVEVDWSPKSGIELEDKYVDKIFKPCMEVLVETVLPKPQGKGEGSSMEEARMKAFIERDISRAGGGSDIKDRPDLPDLSEFGLHRPRQSGGGSDGSNLTYEDLRMFVHCEHCMKERPEGISPAEFASFEVGIALNRKLAVYCKRHKKVVGEFTLKNPPPVECECDKCREEVKFEKGEESAGT